MYDDKNSVWGVIGSLTCIALFLFLAAWFAFASCATRTEAQIIRPTPTPSPTSAPVEPPFPELFVVKQDVIVYDFIVKPYDFFVILQVEGNVAWWLPLDLKTDDESHSWGVRIWFADAKCSGLFAAGELVMVDEVSFDLPREELADYCKFVPIAFGGLKNEESSTSLRFSWTGPESDDARGNRRNSSAGCDASKVAANHSNRSGTWLFNACDD